MQKQLRKFSLVTRQPETKLESLRAARALDMSLRVAKAGEFTV